MRVTQYVQLGAEDETTISVPRSEILADRVEASPHDPNGRAKTNPLFVAGCVTTGAGALVAIGALALNVARTFPFAKPLSGTEDMMIFGGAVGVAAGVSMILVGTTTW